MGTVMIRDVGVVTHPIVSEMFLPREILEQIRIFMKTSLHEKNPIVFPLVVVVQRMIGLMVNRIVVVAVLECSACEISHRGSKENQNIVV